MADGRTVAGRPYGSEASRAEIARLTHIGAAIRTVIALPAGPAPPDMAALLHRLG